MASYFPIVGVPSTLNLKGYSYPYQLRDQVLNRLWGEGRWKSVERRLEYCQAQNYLHQGQRIPVPAIVEFFRKYKFQRFTYDPSNPIDKEFDRLCQQRQWGQVKISQAWEEYDLAELQSALWQQQLEQSLARSAINEIFQNHEVDIFTYDASADPITNLQRLIARQKKILKDLQKQQRKSALAMVEFFSQYEFEQYTYDPSNPPDVEFRRLCQQRQWGPKRTRQARQEYNLAQQQLALSQQQQSLAQSSFAQVIQNQEFVNFTCDTNAEFQRLCQQRQWGPVRIARAQLEYEEAQQESILWQEQWGQPLAQSAVVEYFENCEFDNSGSDTSSNTSEIPLLELVGELPAVEFLRAQRVEGYTYSSGLLHEEFRGLLNAREAEWEADLPAESNQATFLATGHALAPTTAREEWIEEWRTIERELREEFQFKIENEFNVLMDFIGKSTGLEAWEVLVELYGVGKAPLGQDEAEHALKSINVNIYDFIGAIKDALRVPTKGNVGSPIPLLAPSVQKLNFPDEHMLSFYSKYTDRVFNRNNAMENGTLVFLLRPLAQHWKDYKQQKKHFEEEAGWGALALIRGENARPHAIRELLLSRRADPIGEFWRLLTTQSKALKALQERTSAPDIVEFFKEYEFQRFTYDPSNPPDAEFQRLCQQRQWGPVRIAQARLEYEDAQQESILWQEQWGQPLAQSAVVEYFGNRKFDNSGYDTSSGEIPLLALVGELPAVKFLRAQSVEGYTYSSGLLHEEFRGLLNAREAEWEASLPAESNQATFLATGHALAPTTAREEWIEEWRTIERELKEEFQFEIEDEFDVLMDFIGRSTGLEAWEVLVELYGVGKALLGQDGAERALESVNVNIYDFIGAIKDALRVPTKGNVGSPIPLLAPSVQKLNFPDEHMLSFYSKYTDRVFNRNNAMEHGTLVFLLRPLAQHWKDYKQQKKHFEEEAGWGALALIRGGNARPHAIRELLLSRRWSFLHN
ncbi:hypothetical protein L873DRAFT_1793064 [Choiromyces venosus 120613-1]|uniref:Uncharacterized protein n=1 Tax=Choiromyces venosus 120613-1 TaxID=1336337 RepID=A0A3N4J7L8_9PEZI|nr:hypothetical protein L873DRAFT_1793064 [Choiromyces venosus 120613-1]